MTRSENKGTVLILNSNIGLQLWLGTILQAEGYTPIPAMDPTSAFELLAVFGLTIDLLILDPTLTDSREFAEHVQHSQRHLQVVSVTPEISNGLSDKQWIDIIRRALAPAATA